MRTVKLGRKVADVSGLFFDLIKEEFEVESISTERDETCIHLADEETKDPAYVVQLWMDKAQEKPSLSVMLERKRIYESYLLAKDGRRNALRERREAAGAPSHVDPGKIIFVVPSIIHFVERPLSYSNVRSVYPPEARAAQTRESIASIRKAVPGAKVVLIEIGLNERLPGGLERDSDKYLYAGGNPAIRRIADGMNKGHGEAAALLFADRILRASGASYFFKLSGRYCLSEQFRLEPWLAVKDAMVAKKYTTSCVCTKLYGFASDFYGSWRSGLLRAIPDLRFGWAIEDTIPKFINIRHLQPIGVVGLIAPYGVGGNE